MSFSDFRISFVKPHINKNCYNSRPNNDIGMKPGAPCKIEKGKTITSKNDDDFMSKKL